MKLFLVLLLEPLPPEYLDVSGGQRLPLTARMKGALRVARVRSGNAESQFQNTP